MVGCPWQGPIGLDPNLTLAKGKVKGHASHMCHKVQLSSHFEVFGYENWGKKNEIQEETWALAQFNSTINKLLALRPPKNTLSCRKLH